MERKRGRGIVCPSSFFLLFAGAVEWKMGEKHFEKRKERERRGPSSPLSLPSSLPFAVRHQKRRLRDGD